MAVMSLRWLAAVLAWLPAVSANLGREQPDPWAPVQTPAPKPEAEINLAQAVLTARHAVRGVLQKRDTNTCGYVNGNPCQS